MSHLTLLPALPVRDEYNEQYLRRRCSSCSSSWVSERASVPLTLDRLTCGECEWKARTLLLVGRTVVSMTFGQDHEGYTVAYLVMDDGSEVTVS